MNANDFHRAWELHRAITLFVLPFCALCGVLSVVGTVTWIRRHASDARRAARTLSLSGAAALPGVMLILELGARWIGGTLGSPGSTQVYEFPTTMIGYVWWMVGPFLFAASAAARPKSPSVMGLNLVQSGHALTWLSASILSFQFAVLV